MKTPGAPWAVKNCTAHHGLIACNTSGSWVMLSTPSAASARNHMPVTGPNTLPHRTDAAPRRAGRTRIGTQALSADGAGPDARPRLPGAWGAGRGDPPAHRRTDPRHRLADLADHPCRQLDGDPRLDARSAEHTSELKSLMRIS